MGSKGRRDREQGEGGEWAGLDGESEEEKKWRETEKIDRESEGEKKTREEREKEWNKESEGRKGDRENEVRYERIRGERSKQGKMGIESSRGFKIIN